MINDPIYYKFIFKQKFYIEDTLFKKNYTLGFQPFQMMTLIFWKNYTYRQRLKKWIKLSRLAKVVDT